MDLKRIEAVLRLLGQQGHVDTLTVEGEGWRVRARRAAGMPPPAPEVPEEPARPPARVIRAGMVGIFRAPGGLLRAGAFVNPGEAVGSIDSMRILNPVTAPEGGYVLDVLVEDGEPVEYGQDLFVLASELPAADGSR